MDPIKKRKIDDTGVVKAEPDSFSPLMLTIDDARKILESFTHDQLLEIVQNALLRHPDVLDAVRSLADRDTTQRKLFIRGLGWETTTEKLRALFSSYGELDEAVVILDKVTGKSKGYGFITFKHIDGAIMALKEPSKKIDGRMTVTQLAAAGISGGGRPGAGGGVGGVNNAVDVSLRKIYVSNVPYDMPAERLLQHFSMYGEIEEGPLGFDKATGKSKGFALFVYKTAEAARASLVDPIKNIDGHQLNCKLAIDGKRGKPPGAGAVGPMGVQGGNQGNVDGIGSTMPGGQYGGPGGIGGHYGGFSGGLGAAVGGPGLSTIGNQAAGSNLGVSGGLVLGLVDIMLVVLILVGLWEPDMVG
ncbi:UNVERIFIED_CONTAM: UBP1-associated protein 2C [Sesamum latifolium]|uniref:UBP1-associated protein 2C n=1 Tax=Sesamum latifolium TaxID=2727402 RepID=A0AAW2TP80_9LAMI